MGSQVFQCIIALAVAVGVGLYAATRSERIQGSVVALMAAIAIWTAGLALRAIGPPSGTVWLVFAGYYLGAVAIAPLWAILAARLTRVEWLSTRAALWLGVPSGLAYLAASTNPFHHWYFRTDLPELRAPLAEIATPLLWAFTGWSYLLVATGIVLFARSGFRVLRAGQWLRGSSITAAGCLPLVAGIFNTLQISAPESNLTPIAIATAVSALFVLHWRYEMREKLPLARRDVIEHLIDGVIILDETGLILDANPSAEEIMGAEAGSLHGKRLIDAVRGSNVLIAPERLQRAADDSTTSEGPWTHTFDTRDGRLIEASTSEVRGGDGEPAGFFTAFRDLTERRRMEQFLRQSQRMETMAGLSAGIAHEINNPLAYIRSNLNHIVELACTLEETLQEWQDAKLDECQEIRTVAEECSEGIDRIGGIVDRMRRFSRIGTDEWSEVDIHAALDDALKMARLRSGSSVTLNYRIDSTLPRVRASHEHLVQLLLNLCANARQAVAGCDHPTIEIETAASPDEVRVCIRDNGPGIPSRIRGRIFDPFFTTKSPGEGTGLGLPIAYGIAREHGGTLEFEAPPAGGAQFTLRLPTLSDDAPDA